MLRAGMTLRHLSPIHGFTYLPPANKVCEGYVFTPVCQSFCSQGVGWGYPSMHCRWYPSMPCRSPGGSPGPHPGGKLRGLARGVSRLTPRGKLRGLALGVSRPHPGGCFQAHTQGVSRPTPGGSAGEVEGSGQGGSPGSHRGGKLRDLAGGGVSRPHPCLQAHTRGRYPSMH